METIGLAFRTYGPTVVSPKLLLKSLSALLNHVVRLLGSLFFFEIRISRATGVEFQ
jgi:hypothetical protein